MTTPEQLEIIIDDLRRMQTGANVHTINKAVGYLRSLAGPVWFIEDDSNRVKMFDQHVLNCSSAISRGDVYVLRCQMRRWF